MSGDLAADVASATTIDLANDDIGEETRLALFGSHFEPDQGNY